jgi:hypothetical protein
LTRTTSLFITLQPVFTLGVARVKAFLDWDARL